MLILKIERYKLPITILLVSFIILVGFRKIKTITKDFSTNKNPKEYVTFDELESVSKDNIYYESVNQDNVYCGISKVDKVIENKSSYYTLIKGESVYIKDFQNSYYTIIDREGKEFKVSNNYIEFKKGRKKASRGSNFNSLSRGELITKVVSAAYKNLGKPYRYGSVGPNYFDCSGLICSIYLNELDIKLERTSSYQINNGQEIDRKNLVPGDLVFFRTSGRKIGHVGLYIGDNNMIHASSGQKRIIITNINRSDYYNSRYVTGRRIIK